MLAAVLAPLVLGGCGLPVGVQIASLFADGISLLTTDKTLTDHGISAIADQDCAVWRGVKGEDICQDQAFDPEDTADLGGPALKDEPAEGKPGDEPEDAAEDAPTAAPGPLGPPGPAVESFALAANTAPTAANGPETVPARLKTPKAPAPKHYHAKAPGHYHAKAKGGTFYVIASYRRLGNARRFAGGQSQWVAKVISGTASGRPVYRVAIGPVAKDHRRYVHARLIKDGYADVWALTLKKPQVITDLAALD